MQHDTSPLECTSGLGGSDATVMDDVVCECIEEQELARHSNIVRSTVVAVEPERNVTLSVDADRNGGAIFAERSLKRLKMFCQNLCPHAYHVPNRLPVVSQQVRSIRGDISPVIEENDAKDAICPQE
jgi:hypothetical protein